MYDLVWKDLQPNDVSVLENVNLEAFLGKKNMCQINQPDKISPGVCRTVSE